MRNLRNLDPTSMRRGLLRSKAPHQTVGGYRCEAVTASVGIMVHRGRKLMKTNWRGGNSRHAERNDVCSLLDRSSLVSGVRPDPGLSPGAATCRLTPGTFC